MQKDLEQEIVTWRSRNHCCRFEVTDVGGDFIDGPCSSMKSPLLSIRRRESGEEAIETFQVACGVVLVLGRKTGREHR